MAEVRDLATGLLFPEGPVAMDDGSVIVTEIARGTITRVGADGATDVVAETGGGPNGAAIGPDGRLYVCNNGEASTTRHGRADVPGAATEQARRRADRARRPRVRRRRGALHRVRRTAAPRHRTTSCSTRTAGSGSPTTASARTARTIAPASSTRARRLGVREVVHPLDAPNGIGLSPDGTRLYVAETYTGVRVVVAVAGPAGVVERRRDCAPQRAAAHAAARLPVPRLARLSTATATSASPRSVHGGITVVSPEAARWSSSSLPATPSPPTSASAATTCGPRT